MSDHVFYSTPNYEVSHKGKYVTIAHRGTGERMTIPYPVLVRIVMAAKEDGQKAGKS